MAPYQSQPVKSLNESSGGKRFVFKNFEQRVSEIEIDVFRNLDHLKTEPSEGSSFFRDSLLYWRELNTAEDFISFYEEMMPWVQTLPQILLYKDTIISKLLCRLKMQAALSLEPILRLIASLSRDLLEDFLPFLQKIVDSLLDLLKNGGDREPEILEQVFTSWSYIMMHLQKYLTQDIANVMKVTVRLRYYPKHYVQEFMAEAVAYLLRNAPVQQLIKGVRKVIHEAVKKPLSPRKYGVSALLWQVMRGTSSKFHSRAKEVLRLLMDKFIMHSGDDFAQGSDTIIEVISVALERACEELAAGELTLILDCSFEQMFDCVDNRDLLHLSRLLSFIVTMVKYGKGKKISDLKPILEFVGLLVQRYVMAPSTEVEGYCNELLDRVLQLMLHLLDIPRISNDLTLMSSIVQQWEPVFLLRNLRLLTFMKALLGKDASVLYALRGPIVSAMDDLMETSSEEVIYLMLIFFEKLQGKLHSSNISSSLGISDGILSHWIRRITELASDETLSDISIHKSDLAVLWGVLFCYPYFCSSQADSSLIVKLVDALDQLLLTESEKIGGIEKPAWQSLVGAALASYQKVFCCTSADLQEISCFLSHATSYKSSQQVLCAVAEFLDSTLRSTSSNESKPTLHPELDVIKRDNAVHIFAENLGAPNKEIRISTLRILCHFEPLDHELDSTVDHVAKKLKTEGSQQDIQCCNVIQLLHSIEVTPLSIFASRQADIQISRIERGLSAARISKTDISITLYGILGILHNRFAQLWVPALKCLTTLLGNYVGLIWDIFIQYFEKCQNNFEASRDQVETLSLECPNNLNDLTKKFNSFLSPLSDSTPSSTIIILLLQSLQREKVPSIVQTRSRQLLPLFFKFMGYTSGDISSVSHFSPHACEGKEWRLVLKEWLNLLKLMRNPKSLYQCCALKEILIYRLLDDMDADVQLKVLDCLLTWKDDFLLPYEQNLRNLITSKNLREELTTWTLSRDSNNVLEEHRGNLIPLVIRVLIPKIRNLKVLASRKHAGVQHRRAVLCFLQQLDLDELPLFFSLLLKPLNPVAHVLEDFEKQRWSSCDAFVSEFLRSNFVENFSTENINNLSWKKRSGFLHVTEDILSTFDGFHIIPFLNLLMLFVVRMLESCTISLVRAKYSYPSVAENHSAGDAEETNAGADKMFKKNNALKLRSLCLKIISFVLHKYESHDFGTQFWDSFFMSVKPLVDSFKQEGSSSEKPSSLFSCFLAMSRSSNLVSLLAREEHLVSSIFSILTVKTASNAIIASVLSFIENLLYLDSDIDSHEDSGIKRVLLPNVEALIFNLHCLFTCRKGESRKSVTWPGKTELKIFLLLSNQFIAEECIEGLHVIQGILPVVGLEAVGKILAALAPLLVFAELDVRLCVCDVLDGLAVKKPSLDFLAKLLRSLNAVSTEEIGEFDYDARVNAYEKITPELFFMLEEDSALVILSHCIYDMSSEELILRQSASKSLLSFVKFSAVLLGPNEASQQDMLSHDRICENGQPETDVGWARTSILRIVNKFLLKHVGDAMTKAVSIQKEWLALLRCMILNLPTVPTLNSFKPLCSDDAEIDFFNNILHLQKHRRAKALSRFRNVVAAGNLSEAVTTKIFVPLFFNMLFEVKDGKGEHVRDACLDSLASVSCIMQWETYHLFLIRCFREIRLKPDKEKILVRLICSILDKFHFRQGKKDISHSDDFSSDAPIVPHDIQTTLQKSVLPEIQKLLTSESEKVNANISVAALKLLKLLPQDVMESQLPSIIQRISNFLKNRLESVRDEARSALAACVMELGPAYLHFIAKVLKSTLRRGYELHVLGYTLNFILAKMATDFLPGKLDYCLEEILVVAENDILGDVAEEKEVEKIASKMKETRKSKSFDTLKLMAQSITFKTHAVKLLSPVKSCLDKHLTQKVKTKADCMLHHIALGIECNPSVDPADLFVFAYGLIEDGINGENSQSSHLITVFALGVLNNRLKSMKLNKKDDQLLSLLDPLVGLLGNCLKSKYEDIVSTALKCFTPLMKLPLPSLRYQAKDIKNFLLDFTQRSGNASNPLTHTCLKLLTVLLQSDKVTLSDGQLKDLVQFLSVEIENESAQVVLSLLKAIVGRRLVINEIYDLVKRVGELMVRSQSEPIRKKCSQILLQFLLDYPLHDKRLQQHLDFLLENLSYVHPSGREAVLEMVHAVLKKFPKEVLTVHASNFFFKLILCLANENDNKVCMMVGAAIKLLIERISKQALHAIIDASLIWYSSEKPKSWSTGAQALGLLVEALKKGFQNYVDDILQVARRVLASAAHIAGDNAKEISDEDKIPLWKESYYTFIMLEKILLQFQDLFFEKNLEGIWDLVCKFLLHPHMRLQNISSQLVAVYFAEVSNAKSNRENLNLETCYLMEPSKLFPIAVSFCCQLRSKLLEEMHANLITQNLAFAFCGIHSFLSRRNGTTPLEFWSMLGLSERDSFLKAFEALGSRRGTETFFLCVSGDQNAQDGTENLQSLLARPLLKKMGKVALQMDDIQMKVVFNCFKVISLQIGPEGSSGYGMQLLEPLYRVSEGFAGKEVSDEIKQLAAEVRDSIREVMGIETFVQMYNQIRKSLKGKRDRRKQQLKRMTVINPMRHAKRKLRIAEKHRANKRRKIDKMKERRR
ncbi:hypothetical protein H6P81_004860 [Aristolochia fimbriata]|uniref:Small subunit processome component 20 homolog n=1 Tax=Aristolochia fimbriata TaxID=158543 RepID=A0AAV7ETZ8_ARIFI|nr:hypothetical protein H6P81_004860 [Aristolochia fimbriata]